MRTEKLCFANAPGPGPLSFTRGLGGGLMFLFLSVHYVRRPELKSTVSTTEKCCCTAGQKRTDTEDGSA